MIVVTRWVLIKSILSLFSCYILEIIRNVPLDRLIQSKMTCIKDLVDSKLFRMPQCREILLPEFCREIKEKLESKEEVSGRFLFAVLNMAWFVVLSCVCRK